MDNFDRRVIEITLIMTLVNTVLIIALGFILVT